MTARSRSLERRGYLIVEPHPDHGRLQARLTDRATPVVELIDDTFTDLMGDLVDGLGQQQFDSFKLGLAVLAAEPVIAEIPQLWETYRSVPVNFG